MNKTLTITKNGKIFKCDQCGKFYVEYKNLCFRFTGEELQYFADYIVNTDGALWEKTFSNSLFSRKIMITINHKNANVLLTKRELEELKSLLLQVVYKEKVIIEDNYTIGLN